MTKPAAKSQASRILTEAIAKTDKVQDELHQAVETLGSANALLSDPIAPTQAAAAVADAVEQTLAAETKVQDAVQELEAVKDLIKEAQVEQADEATTGKVGEGTASILAYFEGRRAQARDDEAEQAKGPA